MGEVEIPEELLEYKKYVRRVYTTTTFDPERGHYRAVAIRIEFPEGHFEDIYIPQE